MFLRQLKLAGFKSFVDPITIPLQSPLVGIVGPNGCGKSNIIDAVRWVLGESSAKNLRSEIMSDVIFNGSSQRKALGQASVELIFDNSVKSLSGQYASYQEIAIKRVVTRDGESTYYFNGTRCRRRDITDIFLGTGAGARGYSIISQGTISRLVEAKPEELRAYLEEAAGTSKYKERRRETLQRIAATRENLVRVTDIRMELAKKIDHLEKQAVAANQYQALCEQERTLKAEISALKWQNFNKQKQRFNEQIEARNLALAKHQAKAAEAYQQQVQTSLQLTTENEALQGLQSNFYQNTAEIARLEEHQLQQQREKQRLLAELETLKNDHEQLKQQINTDKEALQSEQNEQTQLQIQLDELRTQVMQKTQQIQILQDDEHASQTLLTQLQQDLQESQNTIALAQIQATHNQQRAEEIRAQLQTILTEKASLQDLLQDSDLSELKSKQSDLQKEVAAQENDIHTASDNEQQLLTKLNSLDKTVAEQKDTVFQLNTKLAALQAWIAQALGQDENNLESQSTWHAKKRLAETIQVESVWQNVCEIILGDMLHGVIVDDMQDCIQALKTQTLPIGMYASSKESKEFAHNKFPQLLSKIQGVHPHYVFDLSTIYAASTLDEALNWLPQIESCESIVTPDGYWLGQGWLRVLNLQGIEASSVLARQAERTKVQKDLAHAEQLLEQSMQAHALFAAEIVETNEHMRALQQRLMISNERLNQCSLELNNHERTLEQFSLKSQALTEQEHELSARLAELQHLYAENEQQAAEKKKEMEQLTARLQIAKADNHSIQKNLLPYKQEEAALLQTVRHLELTMEKALLTVNQLTLNIQRDVLRQETLQTRLSTNTAKLDELQKPDDDVQVTLSNKLQQQQTLETLIAAKKQELHILNEALETYTRTTKDEELKANSVKEDIQRIQIEEQVLMVKMNGMIETLTELGATLEELLPRLTPELTLAAHEEKLVDLVETIKSLGAINLAAIEEYEVESKRKDYLDQQNQDLTDALALLETAIATIDDEMYQRFHSMFNEINQRFGQLFSRLFGGGHAVLSLTCDNLLEAGVNVKANPPGKRNSTIHQLSGGEKALTAMALIFAVFQLNPSPFCMLDEVDAPLDEVNVGRFCALMKEMSEVVQFLFTTHNKVTMMLAGQLIGVTMREAGVSRIVAVDVEQALLMSESRN